MRSRLRASEIVLNVIDMNHEIMATYSLILRFSAKAIKLNIRSTWKKGSIRYYEYNCQTRLWQLLHLQKKVSRDNTNYSEDNDVL